MARGMTEAILALDIGTTACRAVVFSADGKLLTESYREYPSIHRPGGIVEQDAESWWDVGMQCARDACLEAECAGTTVRVIGLSAQGHSWVPVDRHLRPMENAICWLDTRSVGEVREVLERVDPARAARTTGKLLGPWHMLPQLLWMRKHKPKAVNDAHKLLLCADFIIARLTGRTVTDPTMAAGTYLLDVSAGEWSEWLLEEFGIEREKLPELKWPGTVVGPLTKAAADQLGLTEPEPVVLGGQDQKCAAFGAGIAPGRATLSLGTSTAVSAIAARPAFDESSRIPVFPSLLPRQWIVEAPIATTGAALRWARDAIGGGGDDYQTLNELAAESPIGAQGVSFLPYLSGAASPHWVPGARGAFFGLELGTRRADLVRAVMEGVAAEIALNVDALEKATQPVEEVVLFGGGSRSDVWAGIICGLIGRPLLISAVPETAAAGAGALAAFGAGFYASPEAAFDAFRPQMQTLRPDPETEAQWKALSARYRKLRTALIGLSPPS